MKEDTDLVGSRFTQTLYISNEAIETGISMYNLRDIVTKSVKIKNI